ncbi:MAG: glycoside hydrolase N-terminal domain-containing protein, partial [Armatimonadetes bacterium]|nr:glycoside hydrolase N-terminal domain-containing protein [Armatimonadota bacterium]
MLHLPLTHPHGHRLTHHRAPERWSDGFPLGNGELGAMLWGGTPALCLTLDRADWWDLREDRGYLDQPEWSYAGLRRMVAEGRFDDLRAVFEERFAADNPVGPTKLSLGRAELPLPADSRVEMTLDLDRAVVTGRIRAGGREHALTCFVFRDRNVLALALDPWPAGAAVRLVPLAETCAALLALGHPPPRRSEDGDLSIVTQTIPGGPSCALVWNATGPEVFVATETGDTLAEAEERARAAWRAAAEAGLATLREAHEAAWERFWSSSGVFLPDADAERMWYYGVYLLASCARRGSTPPGLQGLWAMDGVIPPWRGDYHADMNVQETFWPALGSGHLDLLDCWCDHMRACAEPAREFTRRFYGTEGTCWVCSTVPDYTLVPCWWTVQVAWSNSGWLASLVWHRWRCSLDPAWLAATGYPLVADIFRFYRANLEPADDGCLHVPLSSSPEYRENLPAAWCRDPSIDLALIRRTCAWLIEMEQALGRDELSADAARVRDALPPYALDEHGGLALWPGQPLDESHRHPSHLMAIHPAMDLTREGDDTERAVIQASLGRYCALGQWQWAGHTYAQMISLAAVLGRGG